MSETIAARDAAQREIEAKNAFLMEKSTLVDSLAEDISVLSTEIADLQTAINKETALREKDQANNNMTLSEAQAGLEAVENAIEVLSNFYTALLQTKTSLKKQAPAPGLETSGDYQRYRAEGAGADGNTVDDLAPEDASLNSDYGGKTDASKSILGLLDVIKSDFEKTIDDTESDEDKAQTAYEEFKNDAQKSSDDKSDLKGTKEGEKTTAELDITQAQADLKAEQTNLENELAELEKLKPVCVESGATHAERTARREQEVEALKEALKILQETDFGF
jgi:chromosome segregation ATPase